jgi:hypothetical protein
MLAQKSGINKHVFDVRRKDSGQSLPFWLPYSAWSGNNIPIKAKVYRSLDDFCL